MAISRELRNKLGIEALPGNIPQFNNGFVINGVGRGKTFYVNAVSGLGSDTNSGLTPSAALATLAAAYEKTRDGYNDVVVLIGGATANALTASITWSNSYTHLIGLSAPIDIGQRCRVTGSATADLTTLITLSGSGCMFHNVQFYNGADANADSGAVVVSGSRNHFENCFIVGMQHATPGARAGSYSLSVTGSENTFENCAVGTDTVIRAAANGELVLTGSKNTFRDCKFMSYAETAGKGLVKFVNSVAGINFFEDCLFYNLWANWADNLDNAFLVSGTNATHFIVLRGNCQLVGVDGWGDTKDHIYVSGPVPNAGYGVSTNPTT